MNINTFVETVNTQKLIYVLRPHYKNSFNFLLNDLLLFVATYLCIFSIDKRFIVVFRFLVKMQAFRGARGPQFGGETPGGLGKQSHFFCAGI